MQISFGAPRRLNVRQLSVNDWQVHWVTERVLFPAEAVAESLGLVKRWQQTCSGIEDTWVQRECGVPTLWLKFDCVIDETSGRLGVYEIDDCPDGLGVGCLVNRSFARELEMFQSTWPKFRAVVADGRTTDDTLWLSLETIRLETMNGYRGQILPRPHRLGDDRFAPLAERSVGPCLTQGSKHYGLGLGLWQPVQHETELNWHESFVLKTPFGYGGSGIYIRHEGRFSGVTGKGKIRAAFQKHGTMYRQPFIMPMTCPFDPSYLMVLRPFFGFDRLSNSYRYLGGFWLARPGNLKLHGAADALVGPLM